MPAKRYAKITESQVISTSPTILLNYQLIARYGDEAHLTLYDTHKEPQPWQLPDLRILATTDCTPNTPYPTTRPPILAQTGIYAALDGDGAIAYIVTQDKA